MIFSVPHVVFVTGVFVNTGQKAPSSLTEIGDRIIGTTRNSLTHSYAQSEGWKKLRLYESLPDALAALDRGECEAVLAAQVIAAHYIRTLGFTHVQNANLPVPGLDYGLHLATHPTDPNLLYKLNKGLANIRANGVYDQIHERWIGPLEPRSVRLKDVRPYLIGLAVLVLGVIAAFAWQRHLLQRLARQAEELHQRQEQLTLVLEGSDDGFWDWDVPSDRIERSERWAAMLGYTLAEANHDPDFVFKHVHPDDLPGYRKFRDLLASGATERFQTEYRLRTKTNEWRWILDRGKVVTRTADGRPLRLAGTHTDITERKRTDAALAENRALLNRSAQLLEQTQAVAHIGGWEIDLTNNRVFWTAENYRLHETTPEEFLPTLEKALEFYVPECRSAITAAIEQAKTQGVPFELELELITHRHRRIRVQTTGRVERVDGRTVRIYGSHRDITAERSAEDEREHLRLKMLEAQKLESLGVLAGGIAHDFNNLLTVILANVAFVREDSPPATNDSLNQIETAASSAANLCHQMLAYAGRGNFIVEPVNLGQLVQETATLLKASISKKARLSLALAEQLPAVEADAAQLRQVVMNLVVNASEALGDSAGEIVLSTWRGRPETTPSGAVYSFASPTGDYVCLEVADTGHGMEPATLSRIFDPFFTTKFTGRGLGLAAVLGIVRAHRGTLTVQSAPKHGTTFRLYLPLTPTPVQEAAAPLQPAALAAPPAKLGTILIADDEPMVLMAVDAILRHAGYSTLTAADGLEAVRLFSAQADIISGAILDLTMPGLNGAEALREIRRIRPDMRVLVMSGYTERDVLEHLQGQSPVAIMRKPFTQETLVARVAALVAR
jgi:PAS domain S-box-containing protein